MTVERGEVHPLQKFLGWNQRLSIGDLIAEGSMLTQSETMIAFSTC